MVTPAPVAPTVDFSGTPRTGFLPLPVTFTDASTNGGAPITFETLNGNVRARKGAGR